MAASLAALVCARRCAGNLGALAAVARGGVAPGPPRRRRGSARRGITTEQHKVPARRDRRGVLVAATLKPATWALAADRCVSSQRRSSAWHARGTRAGAVPAQPCARPAPTLTPPEEGWKGEQSEREDVFRQYLERADKIDRGELNPHSRWVKLTCGTRPDQVCYYNRDLRCATLAPPNEGWRKEQEEEDSHVFLRLLAKAQEFTSEMQPV